MTARGRQLYRLSFSSVVISLRICCCDYVAPSVCMSICLPATVYLPACYCVTVPLCHLRAAAHYSARLHVNSCL